LRKPGQSAPGEKTKEEMLARLKEKEVEAREKRRKERGEGKINI